MIIDCQERRNCQTLPHCDPVPAIFGNLGNFGNCILAGRALVRQTIFSQEFKI
jgi:hypothetical protein